MKVTSRCVGLCGLSLLSCGVRATDCVQFPIERAQHKIARLRKWIIHRLMSIVESPVKKEESLVMDISR